MKPLWVINVFLFLVAIQSCSSSHKNSGQTGMNSISEMKFMQNDTLIENLLHQYPQFFESVMAHRKDLNVQIIYTQINRNNNGVKFTDHTFNVDPERYYYPASTVKLPIAILALQKLNELKIAGLNKNTTMITEENYHGRTCVYNDPSTEDGRPTIANYIKKILLVSDNDAFNRLYEFLGQEYINKQLHKMGYRDVQILHRLQISLTEEENRQTNALRFYDDSSQLIYEQPARKSRLKYAQRDTKLGNGFMRGNVLVNEPFDFSMKNRLSLPDLHLIVRSVIFPNDVNSKQRFNLSEDDYSFLRKYMSMLPRESTFPYYDPAIYNDHYVKFLLYGADTARADPNIRIYNKPGDAYGFMIDAAYIVDQKNNIEFMLSAVIYANSDGIFNDDHYDYDTVSKPFFKNLGQVIYQYELSRVTPQANK